MRFLFGGTAADVTTLPTGRVVPGAQATVWLTRDGDDDRVLDLLTLAGAASAFATSDASGMALFYGPDGYSGPLWLDYGLGYRTLVQPVEMNRPALDMGAVTTGEQWDLSIVGDPVDGYTLNVTTPETSTPELVLDPVPLARLVAGDYAQPSVTVSGSNDTAEFEVSAGGVPLYTVPVVFPAGAYRDSLMAALAVDTAGLPFRFAGDGGRVVVEFMQGAPGLTVTYAGGTATWLGFTVGAEVTAQGAYRPPSLWSLEDRLAALEAGAGGGGGGTVALGGAQCWYASPSGAISTANLGYASGTGVAALSPLFIDQALTFSKIGFEVGTVYPSSVDYTALLYSSADGYPAELLASAVIATGTTGGFKEAAITPIELDPGTYWIGLFVATAESTGALVNNTGVGIMMAHSPSGSGKTGNQRIAAGWKKNPATVAATWPGRTSTGMGTDYRVPRVSIWAG